MLLSPVKSLWGAWKHQSANRPRLWYAGAVLVLTLLLLNQLVSVHLKERQLVRREQVIEKMYEDIHRTVQMTEQIAQRMEQDLHQQEQNLKSMEVNILETNRVSSHVPSPIELPLEQAPSR